MRDLVLSEQEHQQIIPHRERGQQILEQVQRGAVVDGETAGAMSDLGRMAATCIRKSEETRRILVDPLNAHVKLINDAFKKSQHPAAEAKRIATEKVNAWQRKEREEARRRAEEARKREEEEALRLAEEAQKSGDAERADEIVETAAAAAAPPPKQTVVRGNYGATASGSTVWKGEVVSWTDFFLALAGRELSGAEFVRVQQSALNKLARDAREQYGDDADGMILFGIRIRSELQTSLR